MFAGAINDVYDTSLMRENWHLGGLKMRRKRNTNGPYKTVRKQNNKRNVAQSDATTKKLKGDTVNDKLTL